MLTVRKIIETKLLDDYMPDRKSFDSKKTQILDWIKEGKLLVAQGGKYKKKMIPEEAIKLFKDRINMVIENVIK